MKIILNKCFGGFDVSKEAYMLYAKKKRLELYQYASDFVNFKKCIYKKTNDETLFKNYFIKDMGDNIEISNEDYKKYNLYLNDEHRLDPILIEVIEELGKDMSEDEDMWFPMYRNCECCKGFVFKCKGKTCADLGQCFCKMKDECDKKLDGK